MRILCLLLPAIMSLSCDPDRVEGGSCDDSGDCRGALSCIEGTCQIKPDLHREMADQSGVALRSEQHEASAGGIGAVRVRSATAKEFAFAVCGSDERLVGGWCNPVSVGSDNTEGVHQQVSGHTENDTIGARWVCSFRDDTVTANALCQKIKNAQ